MQVNGTLCKEAMKEVVASWPPATGADCVLRGPPGSKDAALVCGQEVHFRLLTRHAKGGHAFSGHEAVAATLTTPLGKIFSLQPVFDQDAGIYSLAVHTQQVPFTAGAAQLQGCPSDTRGGVMCPTMLEVTPCLFVIWEALLDGFGNLPLSRVKYPGIRYPLTLSQSRWCPFMQAGTYLLSANVAGVPVPGCPMSIETTAAQPYLPAFQLSSHAPVRCKAGSRTSFTVVASDIHGNALKVCGCGCGWPVPCGLATEGCYGQCANSIGHQSGWRCR